MKNKPKTPLLIFGDIIGYVYAIFPGLFSWSLTITLLYRYEFCIPLLLASPLILMMSFIFICFVFQRALPKMKPGLYRPGASPQIIVWHLNNALANALENAGLKIPIYSFHTTRWLYWRAMGMTVPFGVVCSTLVTFREYPLITIEKGVSFSAYNHISCHTFEGERLMLGKLHIGENTFIGMNTTVGPRTTIGKNCFIGAHNILYFDKVADNQKIENFEYIFANPKKKMYPSFSKDLFEKS
jgi:NDP-sugar pyrophosphorylase family protein